MHRRRSAPVFVAHADFAALNAPVKKCLQVSFSDEQRFTHARSAALAAGTAANTTAVASRTPVTNRHALPVAVIAILLPGRWAPPAAHR
jgi:hypothetical protein